MGPSLSHKGRGDAVCKVATQSSSPLVGEEGARAAQRRGKVRGATVARARELRRNATDAEKRLWAALRLSLPHAHFRRQPPFGRYYPDFCSHSFRLIIEADGGQHATSASDAQRADFFEGEGYRVLRFWNNDILANTEGVIAEVARNLNAPSPFRAFGAPSLSRRERENGPQPLSRREREGPARRSRVGG